MAPSLFKRRPSQDAELVQQLKLALSSAVDCNRSLQNQLRTEREEKTTIEMALQEEKHRSHRIEQTLVLSQAEVGDLQTLNQRLQEDNTSLRASISEGDIRNLKLEQKIDHQREHFHLVTQALKDSYGQLKQSNKNFQRKIQELSGHMDLQSVHNVQLQQDAEALQEQLTQERQRNTALTQNYEELKKDQSSMTQKVHEMEMTMGRLEDQKCSMKVDQETAAKEAEGITKALEKEMCALRKDLEKQRFTDTIGQMTLKTKDNMIRALKADNTSLQAETQTLNNDSQKLRELLHLKDQELKEERQRNQALEEKAEKHYESTQKDNDMKATWESATKEMDKLQLNLQQKNKLISDLQEKMTRLESELVEERGFCEKIRIKWKDDTAALRKHLINLLEKERLEKSERAVTQLQVQKTTDEGQRSRAQQVTEMEQSRDCWEEETLNKTTDEEQKSEALQETEQSRDCWEEETLNKTTDEEQKSEALQESEQSRDCWEEETLNKTTDEEQKNEALQETEQSRDCWEDNMENVYRKRAIEAQMKIFQKNAHKKAEQINQTMQDKARACEQTQQVV